MKTVKHDHDDSELQYGQGLQTVQGEKPIKARLTDRRIKRVGGKESRRWREYAKLTLDGTEKIFRCHDNSVTTLGYPWTFSADREVRKTGKPIGPWTFLNGAYAFYIRLPEPAGSPS